MSVVGCQLGSPSSNCPLPADCGSRTKIKTVAVRRWGALVCSLLITSVTMWLVTLLTGRDETHLKEVVQEGWLQRSRESLPPLLEHPFLGPVPWWARPSIYATLLMLACLYVVFVTF